MTKKIPTKQRNTALEIACVLDGRRRYLIAALSDLAPQVFSAFVTGRLQPNDDQKKRVAKVLGRPVSELFPETTN